MSEQAFIYTLDLIGTASFAFSGALRGLGRRPDLVGLTILAAATAIGGGIVRDVVLDRTVHMLWDPAYLLVILGAAVATYVFPRKLTGRSSLFEYFDAVGLGVFSAIGAGIAYSTGPAMGFSWYPGVNPISVVFIAAITGAGGGVIRDILLSRMPLVLYREVYILAVVLGAVALIVTRELGGGVIAGFLAAMIVTTGIRIPAIRFGWSLPRAQLAGDQDEGRSEGLH